MYVLLKLGLACVVISDVGFTLDKCTLGNIIPFCELALEDS